TARGVAFDSLLDTAKARITQLESQLASLDKQHGKDLGEDTKRRGALLKKNEALIAMIKRRTADVRSLESENARLYDELAELRLNSVLKEPWHDKADVDRIATLERSTANLSKDLAEANVKRKE